MAEMQELGSRDQRQSSRRNWEEFYWEEEEVGVEPTSLLRSRERRDETKYNDRWIDNSFCKPSPPDRVGFQLTTLSPDPSVHLSAHLFRPLPSAW